MRILSLAKELGIPFETILNWCERAGLSYRHPEDEVDPQDESKIRFTFKLQGPSIKKKDEADFESEFKKLMGDSDSDLDLEGVPKDLDELEALEASLFKTPEVVKKQKKEKGERIAVVSILETYGVGNKSLVKRIRKLLPEHISRLFNHESVTPENAETLKSALENKVHLCCGHTTCLDLLKKEYGKQKIIGTKEPQVCSLCRGSATRRGLTQMAFHCGEKGIKRILIVGGAPASHSELKNDSPAGLEFRLIEGDVSRDKQRAAADLQWCDVVVVWASTILGHEVSNLYMKNSKSHNRQVVLVNRRSIEALCIAVTQHVQRMKD